VTGVIPTRIFKVVQVQKALSPPVPYALDTTATASWSATRPVPGMVPALPLQSESTKNLYLCLVNSYAFAGKRQGVATAPTMMKSTIAVALDKPLTEWIDVLAHRSWVAKTPYKVVEWEVALRLAGLLSKYHTILERLCTGFSFNYPPISSTQAPPNKDSVVEFLEPFQCAVQLELDKGQYLGPLWKIDMERLLSPFQTSPFSINHKPGRPGKFHLLQNLSFPHTPSMEYPSHSTNSLVNSDDSPPLWDI